MRFLEILSQGQPEAMQAALGARLAQNISFFDAHYPALSPLLRRPAAEYELVLGDAGINIRHLKTNAFVFPVIEGKHQMVEASRVLAQTPLSSPHWKLSTNNMGIARMNPSRLPLTGSVIDRLINAAAALHPIHDGTMHLPSRFLPTTTLFGLGGGLYLEMLRESYSQIHSLLIFEESYDFFRISCCFVDYEALFAQVSPKSCFLFIENIVDSKIIKQFFSQHKITSNFIRLELSLYETPKIAEVRSIIALEQASNARGWGTFEDEMVGVRNSLSNLRISHKTCAYPVLASPKKLPIPICIIGNGPSLDGLLPFLRTHQEQMILLSCGTALKPLRKAGITPDFQVEIERLEYLPEVLSDAPLGEIPLLGANVVDPRTVALAHEALLFVRGSSCISYANPARATIENSYPLVGNAAFSLALSLSDTLLLCGLDMAYVPGFAKHASGSMYGEEGREIPKDAHPIKGNLRDVVYADSLFSLSREVAELALLEHRHARVYNLSDGAFIKGTTSAYASALTLPQVDKQEALRQLRSCFTTDSAQIFSRYEESPFEAAYERFYARLEQIMTSPIPDKRAFFRAIDEATHLIVETRRNDPFIGVLLGGSVLHMLHLFFVVMTYVKQDKVMEECSRLGQILLQGVGLLAARYRIISLLSRA